MTIRTDTFLRRWCIMGVSCSSPASGSVHSRPCQFARVDGSFVRGNAALFLRDPLRAAGSDSSLAANRCEGRESQGHPVCRGDGRLNLNPLGFGGNLQANFLVRTRDFYTARGLRAAILDAPPGAAIFPSLCLTAEHAQDIQGVSGYLHRRFHDPVWLVGTSSGTVSAANAASRLCGNEGPNGEVLTSSVLKAPGTSVFHIHLAAITVPTLVVHHKPDACLSTIFVDVPALMAALPGR